MKHFIEIEDISEGETLINVLHIVYVQNVYGIVRIHLIGDDHCCCDTKEDYAAVKSKIKAALGGVDICSELVP